MARKYREEGRSVGLFRPYSQPKDQTSPGPQDTAVTDSAVAGAPKGAPTLSRREAEQARRERLRPTLSKAERKQRERAIRRERQDRQYQEMENHPVRVLLRNYIDSKWTFSEFTWPLLFLMMASFLASPLWEPMALFSAYAIYAVLLGVIIEVLFRWYGFRKLLAERLPGASHRGLVMYMASRMVSMRRFRRPPTALDRGAPF